MTRRTASLALLCLALVVPVVQAADCPRAWSPAQLPVAWCPGPSPVIYQRMPVGPAIAAERACHCSGQCACGCNEGRGCSCATVQADAPQLAPASLAPGRHTSPWSSSWSSSGCPGGRCR